MNEQSPVPVHERIIWSTRDAANMCGVPVSTFTIWVREGFMPQPCKKGRYFADAVRQRTKNNNQLNLPSKYDRWKAAND